MVREEGERERKEGEEGRRKEKERRRKKEREEGGKQREGKVLGSKVLIQSPFSMKVRHSFPLKRPFGEVIRRADSLLGRALQPQGMVTALIELWSDKYKF